MSLFQTEAEMAQWHFIPCAVVELNYSSLANFRLVDNYTGFLDAIRFHNKSAVFNAGRNRANFLWLKFDN